MFLAETSASRQHRLSLFSIPKTLIFVLRQGSVMAKRGCVVPDTRVSSLT
jgi:hypothetical protein